MEYGKMIGDSVEYAREAVWGKWTKWILLIISSIIFPLILGYLMEVFRGKTPAPDLENWGKLFIDGLKFIVAGIIYAIPIILVAFLTIGASVMALMPFAAGGQPDPALMMGVIAGILAGIVLIIILAFIIAIFWYIGVIRMARKDRFGEAFNFGAIFETIRKIGWGSYIVALIVIWVVMIVLSFIIGIVGSIPFIGWLIMLIVMPPLSIFESRYLTLVYESAGETA